MGVGGGADARSFSKPVVSSEVGLLSGAPVCPGVSPSGTILVPFVPHLFYFQKGVSTLVYHGHRSGFLTWGWP